MVDRIRSTFEDRIKALETHPIYKLHDILANTVNELQNKVNALEEWKKLESKCASDESAMKSMYIEDLKIRKLTNQVVIDKRVWEAIKSIASYRNELVDVIRNVEPDWSP